MTEAAGETSDPVVCNKSRTDMEIGWSVAMTIQGEVLSNRKKSKSEW